MRIFTILLSIYFITLNVYPCGDADELGKNAQEITVLEIDNDHSQDCEFCTAFCQCHCCHTHTVVYDLIVFKPIEQPVFKKHFAHIDSKGFEVFNLPFQPPRV